jgi:hypothetical protein
MALPPATGPPIYTLSGLTDFHAMEINLFYEYTRKEKKPEAASIARR